MFTQSRSVGRVPFPHKRLRKEESTERLGKRQPAFTGLHPPPGFGTDRGDNKHTSGDHTSKAIETSRAGTNAVGLRARNGHDVNTHMPGMHFEPLRKKRDFQTAPKSSSLARAEGNRALGNIGIRRFLPPVASNLSSTQRDLVPDGGGPSPKKEKGGTNGDAKKTVKNGGTPEHSASVPSPNHKTPQNASTTGEKREILPRVNKYRALGLKDLLTDRCILEGMRLCDDVYSKLDADIISLLSTHAAANSRRYWSAIRRLANKWGLSARVATQAVQESYLERRIAEQRKWGNDWVLEPRFVVSDIEEAILLVERGSGWKPSEWVFDEDCFRVDERTGFWVFKSRSEIGQKAVRNPAAWKDGSPIPEKSVVLTAFQSPAAAAAPGLCCACSGKSSLSKQPASTASSARTMAAETISLLSSDDEDVDEDADEVVPPRGRRSDQPHSGRETAGKETALGQGEKPQGSDPSGAITSIFSSSSHKRRLSEETSSKEQRPSLLCPPPGRGRVVFYLLDDTLREMRERIVAVKSWKRRILQLYEDGKVPHPTDEYIEGLVAMTETDKLRREIEP